MRVFKLIFTSFVVFSMLSACTSGEKPQAKEQEFSILGTWDFQKVDPSNLACEIIFKEDNKVIMKFQKSVQVDKCTHYREFEGSYNFDSKTNKLSFEENFVWVRDLWRDNGQYICEEEDPTDPDAKILATNSYLFGPSFTDYYVVKDGDYLSITFDCLDKKENAVYKKKIQ